MCIHPPQPARRSCRRGPACADSRAETTPVVSVFGWLTAGLVRYVCAMRFILHYAPDNASLVVRLVLDELGVPFDTQLVDRSRQAQKSPAFRALNPVGRIPVLETPDGPMSETAAILLWLADREGRMAPPPDHKDRAAFLRWLFFVSNTIHAELRLVFYPKTYTDAAGVAALSTTVKSSLLDHFAALDAEIGRAHV